MCTSSAKKNKSFACISIFSRYFCDFFCFLLSYAKFKILISYLFYIKFLHIKCFFLILNKAALKERTLTTLVYWYVTFNSRYRMKRCIIQKHNTCSHASLECVYIFVLFLHKLKDIVRGNVYIFILSSDFEYSSNDCIYRVDKCSQPASISLVFLLMLHITSIWTDLFRNHDE